MTTSVNTKIPKKYVGLRLESELYKRVKREADANQRSVQREIVFRLLRDEKRETA